MAADRRQQEVDAATIQSTQADCSWPRASKPRFSGRFRSRGSEPSGSSPEIVGDYCSWLAEREESLTKDLADTRLGLRNHQRELADLNRRHQELATTLDRINHTATWRLHTLVYRILRRAGRSLAGSEADSNA